MRDLSSPTRDGPHPPAVKAQSLNHWIARKVPDWSDFFELIIYLFLVALGLHCRAGVFACCGEQGQLSCGAQGLGARASVVTAHGLSSCGARAELLWYTWNLLGPRIEPMFPTLAGRLLATAPPGKFPRLVLKVTVELGSHGWRQGMWKKHKACCSHGDLAIFLELMPFRLLQNFG